MTDAGYDYKAIQALVDKGVGKPAPAPAPAPATPAKKSNEEIAAEVWAGIWGNGATRKEVN